MARRSCLVCPRAYMNGTLSDGMFVKGGPREAFAALEPIITKVSAQTDSGPCTTYIGGPGSGNYVKMVRPLKLTLSRLTFLVPGAQWH